jgi:hypothetical protein
MSIGCIPSTSHAHARTRTPTRTPPRVHKQATAIARTPKPAHGRGYGSTTQCCHRSCWCYHRSCRRGAGGQGSPDTSDPTHTPLRHTSCCPRFVAVTFPANRARMAHGKSLCPSCTGRGGGGSAHTRPSTPVHDGGGVALPARYRQGARVVGWGRCRWGCGGNAMRASKRKAAGCGKRWEHNAAAGGRGGGGVSPQREKQAGQAGRHRFQPGVAGTRPAHAGSTPPPPHACPHQP